jgi:hypothetical protein
MKQAPADFSASAALPSPRVGRQSVFSASPPGARSGESTDAGLAFTVLRSVTCLLRDTRPYSVWSLPVAWASASAAFTVLDGCFGVVVLLIRLPSNDVEQIQQDNDRDRDPDQPEKHAAHCLCSDTG